MHAGDEGTRAAYLWLQDKAANAPADLNNSNTGAGYYSSQHANDPSWDPLWANLEIYVQLARDSWRTQRWQDKIALWFKPDELVQFSPTDAAWVG